MPWHAAASGKDPPHLNLRSRGLLGARGTQATGDRVFRRWTSADSKMVAEKAVRFNLTLYT